MLDVSKKVGVWGDSILKGIVFDEIMNNYRLLANSCADLVSRKLGLEILNKSRFGFTINRGISLIEKFLEKNLGVDYVLLEYGGNDCDFDWSAVAAHPDWPHQPNTPLKKFGQQLQYAIDLLRRNHIDPVLMSLPPISGDGYLDFLVNKGLSRQALLSFLGDAQQIYRFQESYSLTITSIALRNQCHYVPIREGFLAEHDSQSLLCADGIHPNEAGHRLMYQVFIQMALA